MPQQPYVGQIMPAAFGMVPQGWAPCNGAILAISQNQALFSLIGTAYGGDGNRTFALPDLRGRALLGCDFPRIPPGAISGTEKVTLMLAELPSHNHPLQAAITTGGGRGAASPEGRLFGTNTAPANLIFATAGGTQTALATNTNIPSTGGTTPHNNMQPFLVINYLIALFGTYPSRP